MDDPRDTEFMYRKWAEAYPNVRERVMALDERIEQLQAAGKDTTMLEEIRRRSDTGLSPR